eukprot:s1438_g4.t1
MVMLVYVGGICALQGAVELVMHWICLLCGSDSSVQKYLQLFHCFTRTSHEEATGEEKKAVLDLLLPC